MPGQPRTRAKNKKRATEIAWDDFGSKEGSSSPHTGEKGKNRYNEVNKNKGADTAAVNEPPAAGPSTADPVKAFHDPGQVLERLLLDQEYRDKVLGPPTHGKKNGGSNQQKKRQYEEPGIYITGDHATVNIYMVDDRDGKRRKVEYCD